MDRQVLDAKSGVALVSKMSPANNTSDIGVRLSRLIEEAYYGLAELAKLKEEGKEIPLFPEAIRALEHIRNTTMFDTMNEYHTLLQKLKLGPVVDADAIGAVEVNVRMIHNWTMEDLWILHAVIQEKDVGQTSREPSQDQLNNQLLGLLLRAVRTQMLNAFSRMSDALDAIEGKEPKRLV